jgi:hypothetical protein
MARIVLVHGVGRQFDGESSLQSEWYPRALDGVLLAGGPRFEASDLVCPFYGDLFRPKGTKGLEPPYTAADMTADEQALLDALWREAGRVDPAVPTADTKVRAPSTAQRALYALSNSRFFSGLSERALIGDLKQLLGYFDERNREAIRRRVVDKLTADTRVVIGHSLGSVVAYEAINAASTRRIKAFITLGSPLGIPHLVLGRLVPHPIAGAGVFPDNVERWTNVADEGDIVALTKALDPLFGGPIHDLRINNGARAHDASRYLTTVETGRAIAAALA